MAGFGVTDTLLSGGAFEAARTELDSLTLPSITAATAGLVCLITSTHAIAAALDRRPNDAVAPMDATTELAERFGATGKADAQGIVFGPVDAGITRMFLALEAGEPDQAVNIARDVHPEQHPFPVNQAHYWLHYGRALARLRKRHDDAVIALRTAEDIFPTKVRRDPMVREVLAELMTHSKKDAVGRELRGMAHRAGLPV